MTRRLLAAGTAATAVTSLTALLGACGDTTTTGVSELNLDRPVDVSFACYRNQNKATTGQSANTALPTRVCQDLSPPLTMTGATTPDDAPDWYGFILQSASGTVALTTWPTVPADSISPSGFPQQLSDTVTSKFKVLDADPLTPGKNALSIGEDPVAIGTDKSGCFELTANAGSCDLSELDITSALSNIVDGNPVRPRIDRVPVFAPTGQPNKKVRILSKPSAMVVEPLLDATVPTACPAQAQSKLYIAYPSCHLVAEVQIAPDPDMGGKLVGTVIGGIQFDGNGAASVLAGQALASLSCPTECAPDPGMTAVPVVSGYRPVALDYRLDPRTDGFGVKPNVTSRLAIGADLGPAMMAAPLTVVDLDLTTFAPLPATLLSIPLEGGDRGPVGVSALALSAQIGMGGNARDPNTPVVDDLTPDQAQYVYAVATDGTVRVADVLTLKRECDTQIDGRFLRNTSPTTLECIAIGRPDLPRRPAARSPGIELPDGAVATSVAIVKGLSAPPKYAFTDSSGKMLQPPLLPQPALLLGYFAVITASSGAIFVANVDDDYVLDNFDPAPDRALGSSPVLVMAHQLRDSMSKRDAAAKDCTSTDPPGVQSTTDPNANDPGGAAEGGPRLTAPPIQQTAPSTLFDDLDSQLPRLQQVACDKGANAPVTALEFGAPAIQPNQSSSTAATVAVARDTAFPELKSVVNENWTLTYEGTLELDSTLNSVNGPSLHFGQAFVDRTGMFIEDPSRPFCHMGVEPGDVVEFRGCDPARGDGDCPAGYTCYVHPSSTVGSGACFLKTEAPRLQDACRDFLSSVRRYTVGTDASGGTAPGKLVLWERKHELSTTPVDGCVSDAQCDDLARAAAVINQSADPFVEPVGGQPQTQWSCQADPLRKAISTDPDRNKRCMQTCTFTPRTAQNQNTNAQAPFCASGTVCVPSVPRDPRSTDPTPGVCMEGIEPAQACLNGPERYLVHAAEAFTVVGDRSGFVHPIIASADGNRCVRDPKLDKDPLSIGRIPLTAPPCKVSDPVADPFTGLIGDSKQFEANPCSLTVQQYELTASYPSSCPDGRAPLCSSGQPAPCPDGHAPLCSDGQPPPRYGACRTPVKSATPDVRTSVPAIKFRNRSLTLTLVDPYRVSSASCLGRDPGNVSTNIPLVVPGYQIAFGVKGGYVPLTLSIGQQVSPIKVVRGPTESIWVIDDGDFIGNGITDVSTRGRVFRIESVPAPPGSNSGVLLLVNTMQ
jgi:hypothetical protein